MADVALYLADEAAMLDLGHRIATHVRIGDVIALEGGLGAGKTTLARGILEALGLAGEAPSPSFAIVQPYDVPEVRLPVAHVDLYRLDTPEDTEELALGDYLMDSLLIVEWPDRLGTRLWPHALRLSIAIEGDGARRLTADVPDAWTERWSQI
ncbi:MULTISPECIES: tRNA (adenosine(37)-N6)-threonylcarbamoyltransferase complex ATPase subunit type 1 TsaE [unclassified Sphingobium]|uniref:tRNA (adenosine(37)-N6)-threonylcarbamoyltransferase complex ATPase subunit type 1 TsaE n=1 Tax=unclassified Sphingobium TaxID=2611147 RepID=UPI000D15D258|nr:MULTISPECIES: tRNA (adenosine(37)-N6)-threonylcarbamoyltransferase complex ATPase subunit type 1 TsaE [unclassified Sphingobium]MBG6116735.1 tRNA threonylcarbamoyladenosine biosynthesis protein TsaE [Sphingobium sp. JAI105]PSO12964.1 tRNA (adenosine(37)-N6)-threonylcarbamoyltransferase complex ATPase subunit type 1 TsaE [Sphingobium sp. AEW4]TWD07078.1 tRNA threonylcarbamoyladenosine biosynthesis protein TsaE [Sphingobium sp. AEW010]TWD24473.1 tRNA threonylcarbamoyladenosine biosynthesis pro